MFIDRKKNIKRKHFACKHFATNFIELLSYGFSYCPVCGKALVEAEETVNEKVCSQCDSIVSENWGYCPYCGEVKDGDSGRKS